MRVTNTNDEAISWWFGAPGSGRPDGKVVIAADGRKTVKVKRRTIVWIAFIGHHGVADRGRVRGINTP